MGIWVLALTVSCCVAIAAAALARRDAGRARNSERRSLGSRAEIASTIAHEVRGPVATIRALAATTTSNYDRLSDAERLEFLGLIDHESLRLLAVVDQISMALKLDAGSVRLELRQVPVKGVVEAGVSAAGLGAHPLEVLVPQGLQARCDSRWTGVILTQLLDNAAKFSPPEAPIRLSACQDQDSVVIEVSDGGPGIPKSQRAGLFARFSRWRPVGYEEQPGSGLGLFICKALLAEQGGDVAIAEEPAGGSILRVRLPGGTVGG